MNAFGRNLRITLFGESHGPGIGCILDGLPPGMPVNTDAVQKALDARRPGTGPLVSARQETDEPEYLSGIHNGRATGAPLALLIRNRDTRSQDYDDVARLPRPGHSDWVAHAWARGHNDPRGGGHYSGRLTAPLVAAGAIVEPLLAACGVTVAAHLDQVGEVGPDGGPRSGSSPGAGDGPGADASLGSGGGPGPDAILGSGGGAGPDAATMRARVAASPVHTANTDQESAFVARIEAARRVKDSVGGVVAFRADGVPAALGDPFFDSVESQLAHLLFAVPAVKGVSFGAGFHAATMAGSQHNDAYLPDPQRPGGMRPATNHAGGILGGRSTGEPVWGHVAIKPASSIFHPQQTVDLVTGEPATLELKGRHDPCIAVRAVPVVQACIGLAMADLLLLGMQHGHVEVPRW